MRKYWTLYDISWSIVAAFFQCLANNQDETGHDIATVAASIADYAIEEINRTFDSSKMNKDCNERTLLLVDIIGILHLIPVYRGKVIDDRCRDIYKCILVHSVLLRYTVPH